METGRGALRVTNLASLDEQALDLFNAIYDEAFPKRQREPFAELVKENTPGADLSFFAMSGEAPLGFCFFSTLPSVGHLFLTYFAIAADRRAEGNGSALWRAVRDALDARGWTGPVVLEVEDPDEAATEPGERDIRCRRMGFWQRAGAALLPDIGYEIPNLDGSGSEPMRLLRFGQAPLKDSCVLPLVLALYAEGYGLDDRHPLIGRAQERLG